ncbi:AsnC family transcriptional regulator [Cereibacter ovatus]|uniref:AsnC family transcriptional regulator n=1 Tax=Cereibacter ovatus TaxID=439529 RepID=A0A285D2U9_9RHOB|nr:Lrp/AsnC family transcriptional regulator [Cereibacter ovatus]SNX74089.1 AsnC family transcriptional regulator [Cereibacter ovatus]
MTLLDTTPESLTRAPAMDRIDRKIIHELQRDCSISIAQLADRVGLSQTPCWKRIQRLEQSGVVTGRVALVDPVRIGLGLTVFVEIEAPDHSPAWRARFAETVTALPEVVGLWRMAGDVDYMLKVVMPDMHAFDRFYQRLTEATAPKNVTSKFAMERMKDTTVYPVNTTDP